MIITKREYQLKEEDRQFLDYLPPVSIFLAGLIFIGGTILAIILYHTPNGSYQFIHQFFSELGLRHDYTATLHDSTTEIRYAPLHPDIFNITLYMTGFLVMPFFLFSYRQMRNNNRVSNLLLLLATFGGFMGGPVLIGVGIFDISVSGDAFWKSHTFWVGWLYGLITLTSIMWYAMLLTSNNLPYRDKTKWIWLDYTFLIVLVFLTLLNMADGVDFIIADNIPLINSFPIEFYQKLIAYIYFIYYGLIVGGRLSKTKYDNTPINHELN